MTNYERIKNMTIEEMARFLGNLECELIAGDLDFEYGDPELFDHCISYINIADDGSRVLKLLNRESDS